MKNLRCTDIFLRHFNTHMNTGLGNSVTGLLEPEYPHTREYMLLPGTLTFLLIIPLNHVFTFSHSSRNLWFNLQIFASFIIPQIPYPTNKILKPLHCFFLCLFFDIPIVPFSVLYILHHACKSHPVRECALSL